MGGSHLDRLLCARRRPLDSDGEPRQADQRPAVAADVGREAASAHVWTRVVALGTPFVFVVGKDSVDYLSKLYLDATAAVTVYRVCSISVLYLDEWYQSCLIAHVTSPMAIRVLSRRRFCRR